MPSATPARPGRRRELAAAIFNDGRLQREIADAAGVSPMTLSGIVTGRIAAPRRSTRMAIAQALGKAEDELFPERVDAAPVEDEQDDEESDLFELTDEQMDFIGAVLAGALRRRRERERHAGAA